MIDMYILIALIVVLVASIVVINIVNYDGVLSFVATAIIVISSVGLFVWLAVGASCFLNSKQLAIRHKAISGTLNGLRENGNSFERTAIFQDIVQFNIYLASYKYWNNNGFDMWYSDDIEKLEPIK